MRSYPPGLSCRLRGASAGSVDHCPTSPPTLIHTWLVVQIARRLGRSAPELAPVRLGFGATLEHSGLAVGGAKLQLEAVEDGPVVAYLGVRSGGPGWGGEGRGLTPLPSSRIPAHLRAGGSHEITAPHHPVHHTTHPLVMPHTTWCSHTHLLNQLRAFSTLRFFQNSSARGQRGMSESPGDGWDLVGWRRRVAGWPGGRGQESLVCTRQEDSTCNDLPDPGGKTPPSSVTTEP